MIYKDLKCKLRIKYDDLRDTLGMYMYEEPKGNASAGVLVLNVALSPTQVKQLRKDGNPTASYMFVYTEVGREILELLPEKRLPRKSQAKKKKTRRKLRRVKQ